jgi:hypothetical protein
LLALQLETKTKEASEDQSQATAAQRRVGYLMQKLANAEAESKNYGLQAKRMARIHRTRLLDGHAFTQEYLGTTAECQPRMSPNLAKFFFYCETDAQTQEGNAA